jgi:N-acetylglutamate synthase-like GNAT family acetyltransferase
MDIIVRKMKSEDMDKVIGILSQWNMAPIKPSPEIPEPIRSSINIDNSFVAMDGELIVGVASYIIKSSEYAETCSLALDPGYRGRGIGYKLQMARLREMKRRGVRKVISHTDRQETIEWYTKKFGYRITGKKKKKHPWSRPDVDERTILELDLENFEIK